MKVLAITTLMALGLLTGCAGTQVTTPYKAALPSCGIDSVRVCDNFGHARTRRGCACMEQSALFFE